jgi:glyoxylase-like metal-dependent hydrolase (beta-lactamase superfamily II)
LIDGLTHPFPGVGMVSYLIEEGLHDLTLFDTYFLTDLPKLEEYLHNAGYKISEIRRIVITHLHPDHSRSINEIRRL